jgi:hypothetical protein
MVLDLHMLLMLVFEVLGELENCNFILLKGLCLYSHHFFVVVDFLSYV